MILRSLGRSVCAAVVLVCAIAALGQVPSSQHVVLVIDENNSYSSVVANMPWLVSQGGANGYATNYQSDNGGSLLDYLWLASGSCESSANCTLPPGTNNFNCSGNDCFYPGTATTDAITDDNIFREMNNAGISWKVYAQSYAAAGGTPTTPDNHNGTAYYRRHNGATWYSDILNNVNGSAAKIVDLSQLSADLQSGTLPRFMIIVPDGNHDAHDCPVGMTSCTEAQQLAAADQFLNDTLGPILGTPAFQTGGDGLAIVTFDECAGGTNAGCGAAVYTALIGPRVKQHTVSSIPYKHENTLRTMLDSLGIRTYPGASATAADMSDFFITAGTKPEVVVSGLAAASSSPTAFVASAYPTSGNWIVGWWVYVDSVAVYHAGAAGSINPSLNLSAGSHTVVVRAWDSSGAFGDQSFPVTVAASKPIVTISAPANNAIVGSPFQLQATASASTGRTIVGWRVYLDSNPVYSAGAANTISSALGIATGTHSVVVRAWDSSGAYGDETITLTVSAKPAVTVWAPAAGANVSSPFTVQASAVSGAGRKIGGWWIYLDGVGVYSAGALDSITANIPASPGVHNVVVRAWDDTATYGDETFSVYVKPVAVNITSPTSGSSVISPVTITAIAQAAEAISGWRVYVDSVYSYGQGSGNSINAILAMAPGTHTIVVRAWDATGAYGDQTIKVAVP